MLKYGKCCILAAMQNNNKATFRFFVQQTLREKWLWIAKFSAALASVIADVFVVIYFGQFFDILASEGTKAELTTQLFWTLGIIMAFEFVIVFGWRVAGYINNIFQPKVIASISNDCFKYIHKHSYRFFTNRFTGALVKKVNKLTRSFENIEDKFFWDMIPMALRVIGITGVLFYIHFLLGALILVWTVIFVVANYFAALYKFKFDLAASNAETKITGQLADTIANSTNVKLFAAHRFEFAKFKSLTERWRKKTKTAWDITDHIELAQGLFMVFLEFVILYASIILWAEGTIGIAGFFIIQTYIFELFHQLWNFGRNVREIYESLADAEEMIEILEKDHEIVDHEDAADLKVLSGKIEFDKVKFRYEKGEAAVIKNLSFKIKPGEKIALIGPSGGGKSTIVKLLLRLFEIQQGKISIDGQNIQKVTRDSLRQGITLVPQDPILFHRSLAENIRYGRRNASMEEVIAAAKMAHCHEFIKKFPNDYQTFVGERGVKLSGGQKQRIAIARAILANPKILVLDEATSSLDSESETIIQHALDNLIKNKTTLIIAHRLSTIMQADRIFVLKDGQIVEEGSHADLVNKKSGLYKKLWDLQVGGYIE